MKLNYKRTILIGFAFMAILAFWQFYDQVIPYLLEVKFGRDILESKIFMAMDNVLAVFLLPLFGKLSDKTHSKLGKRTPYILYGTIASVILLCVLSYFERVSNFWGFIIVLMLLLVAMATYRSPAVAYMPDVTEKPLRSKGNAIINLVGYIGGIFATVLMMFMLKGGEKFVENGEIKIKYPDTLSFTPVFLIIAAFMLGAEAQQPESRGYHLPVGGIAGGELCRSLDEAGEGGLIALPGLAETAEPGRELGQGILLLRVLLLQFLEGVFKRLTVLEVAQQLLAGGSCPAALVAVEDEALGRFVVPGHHQAGFHQILYAFHRHLLFALRLQLCLDSCGQSHGFCGGIAPPHTLKCQPDDSLYLFPPVFLGCSVPFPYLHSSTTSCMRVDSLPAYLEKSSKMVGKSGIIFIRNS